VLKFVIYNYKQNISQNWNQWASRL